MHRDAIPSVLANVVESMHDDSLWDQKFYPWKVVPGRDEDWFEAKRLIYLHMNGAPSQLDLFDHKD